MRDAHLIHDRIAPEERWLYRSSHPRREAGGTMSGGAVRRRVQPGAHRPGGVGARCWAKNVGYDVPGPVRHLPIPREPPDAVKLIAERDNRRLFRGLAIVVLDLAQADAGE